jgi:anion-transporting  ArsA/GET3 family ATPase
MPPAEQHPAVSDRRFIFVTGKGGVGKTTVTAALALSLAARGKRVLVAMCGAHERLSSLLGTPAIGHDLQQVRELIWATKIDPDISMAEYGQLVIRVRAVTRMVFDNQVTKSLFRAIPGIHGWAMLGKAWYHSTELGDDGKPVYDTVLFDAPSTGHGLDMLRIPKVILAVAPPGVLRRDAERAWQQLRDPDYSGVVVVSWPEDLPVTETLELLEALRTELRMPLARLIVNGTLPLLFDDQQRAALLTPLNEALLGEEGASPAEPDPGRQAIAAASRRAVRERLQQQSLVRLQEAAGMPLSTLPYLVEGAASPDAVEKLAQGL